MVSSLTAGLEYFRLTSVSGLVSLRNYLTCGITSDSEVKASACNAGGLGSTPGLGRSPGEGNGNPLWYSCLENPMDRGAWWATVYRGRKESDTNEQLHFHYAETSGPYMLAYYFYYLFVCSVRPGP